MSEEFGDITWNERIEAYFAETGERANCNAWIHKRAEEIYSTRRTWIDLPVIVLSALTGFLSVGSASIFQGWAFSQIILGVFSLFVSVLNTTGSYFGWAKRAEGHRISSIQYAKLYRFLSIEMSLPRDQRMSPHDLLKYTREAYDRLQEISPLVPVAVIADFRSRFGTLAIAKPTEANGLERIVVFEEPSAGVLSPKVPHVQTPPASVPAPHPAVMEISREQVSQSHPIQSAVAVSVPAQTSLTISLPKDSDATQLTSPRAPLPLHPTPDTLSA